MDYPKTKSYSRNAISEILPLDPELIQEIIDYALSLKNAAAIENHLIDILGQSELALRFVSRFLELKKEEEETLRAKQEKLREKLALKPAIPEAPPSKTHPAWKDPVEPVQSPKYRSRKHTPTTTSQLMDKPKPELITREAKKSKRKNLDNLRDIEAALADLELATSKEVSHRRCDCMGQRHPLFEVVPNCLNCGKIICSKEGMQPCSFCGQPLFSEAESDLIKQVLLQEERNLAGDKPESDISRTALPLPAPETKKKAVKVSLSTGKFWDDQMDALAALEEEKRQEKKRKEDEARLAEEVKQQEEELKRYENEKRMVETGDADLVKAQERLETLLDFQATGAERTKIIDRAADFEMPHHSGGAMWFSPVERALQLKRAQKQQRRSENETKARTGRGKRVMEMVIVNGKAQMVENTRYTYSDDEDDAEIEKLELDITLTKMLSEAQALKQVWDYEADTKRWDKPQYLGQQDGDTESPELPRSRLQFGITGDDTTELVAALPS